MYRDVPDASVIALIVGLLYIQHVAFCCVWILEETSTCNTGSLAAYFSSTVTAFHFRDGFERRYN